MALTEGAAPVGSGRRMLTRRATLAALGAPLLGACERRPGLIGGWVGASDARGHRLREARKSGRPPEPSVQRRTEVLVVGGGIAGLGCLRELVRGGVADAHLLELEDTPGGNSRGHQIDGMRCPLGAHYLPVPGDDALEVIELLEALGVMRIEHGRRVYDERHLCHSPQERLFIDGAWHEGLVPPAPPGSSARAAYQAFSAKVAEARRRLGFAIPSARAPWTAGHQALDAISFARWLDGEGLRDPALRTYLDYCCRDDYGAGIEVVSAWAGLHYFASRHGFQAAGEGDAEPEPVLTWPEGNAWLAERMAAPLAAHLHTGRVVWRVEAGRHDVQVDAWNAATGQAERWQARQVVLATPLFVSARLWVNPPEALRLAASAMLHAPWLVANLQLDAPLLEHQGFPPAWDNVVHGSPWLGYVDAMHQSTRPHAGPTVLTLYRALGAGDAAACRAARQQLLDLSWHEAVQAAIHALAGPHLDLPDKLRRVDLMRLGHAMPIPAPGLRSSPALRALSRHDGRNRPLVHLAHSEMSAYSIFEEALYQGCRAAHSVLAQRRL